MSNQEKIISELILLANQHYAESLKPSQYASNAAYTFATAKAAEHHLESAHAAAFVAAMDSTDAQSFYTHQLAHLAHETSKVRNHMNSYSVKASTVHNENASTKDASELFFQGSSVSTQDEGSPPDIHSRYQSAFTDNLSTDANAALNAACRHYSHVYAASFTAYLHAVAVAARYPEGDARKAAFTQAMTARLSADLDHEPISPSFFMQVMCSETTQVMSMLLLVAGLLMLMTGIGGLTIGAVAAVHTAAGLNAASLAVAGTAALGASAGLFAGRFFMANQRAHEQALSRAAVEQMNGHEPSRVQPTA